MPASGSHRERETSSAFSSAATRPSVFSRSRRERAAARRALRCSSWRSPAKIVRPPVTRACSASDRASRQAWHGAGAHLRPGWGRPGKRETLTPLHVQVGQDREVVEALDSLGADDRPGAIREAHERLHQSHPCRVGADRLGQRPVQLDDVRAQPHQLLQARVAGSGVVDRDPAAALAELGEHLRQRLVVGNELVLGYLDHDLVEISRQHLVDDWRREGRGADVQSEVGSVGAASGSRAARIAAASSSAPRPHPCACTNQVSTRRSAIGNRASAS